MATTNDYLTQLQNDKATLVDNLITKGVTASDDETFTELVPKVLNIQGSSNFQITDARSLFIEGARLDILDDLLNLCKNTTNCSNMFVMCSDLISLNLNNFDTSKVTNMMGMFSECSSLISLNLSNFDTSNVVDMNSMFSGCSSLKSIDVSNFDTSNVTNMNSMFIFCSELKSIDVSNFDTSNVVDMNSMFSECSSLTSIDLSSFNTSNVTDSDGLFAGCLNLTSVIINRPEVFRLTGANGFLLTPIEAGNGYIYVPDDLVETYKISYGWTQFANQIKPISELQTKDI